MRKNFVSKKKLVIAITFCGILIITSMVNVIAVKPENPGEPMIPIDLYENIPDAVSVDGDWNIWDYDGHMLSIPEGNIGIGFGENPWIPREKLEVFGNILLTPATDLNNRSIGIAPRDFFGASLLLYGGFGEFSPGDVFIRGGNSLYGTGDVILADEGGGVGIGIDQPEAKLDVDGNVRIRQNLEVTNSKVTNYLQTKYLDVDGNAIVRQILEVTNSVLTNYLKTKYLDAVILEANSTKTKYLHATQTIRTARIITNITTIDGPYFISGGQHTIIAKTHLGTYNIYLPRCSEYMKGYMLIIKQVGTTDGVYVNAFEDDYIDGDDKIYLEGNGSITIQSDGDDWWILSSYP